ncbi:MAG: EamA family transporter [Acidimicrobiales bacterium]
MTAAPVTDASRERHSATLYVLAAAVLFGTTGTAQALGPDNVDPVTVGAVRIAVGATVLLAVARRRNGAGWWRALPRWPLLIGGLAVASYQACFFAAVERTGVAVGTVVALGSAPAFTGALTVFLLRERPVPVWCLATVLAVAGASLIALGGGDASVDAAGVVLALGAGGSYAGYTLASKALLTAGVDSDAAMAAIFSVGALALVPTYVVRSLAWLPTGRGVGLAAFLGVVPTAIAYQLFARGLRRLPGSTVTTLTLAEPATAVVLGALVLGERPGARAVVGMALVGSGLVLLAGRRPRAGRPAHGLASEDGISGSPL